jgi:hypothetical protein
MQTAQFSVTDSARPGVFSLIAEALAFPGGQTDPCGQKEAVDTAVMAATPMRRRGFLERLDRWFWRQQQRDLEAYLARASDVYDLEARIHAIERDKSIPYY